MPLSDRTTLQFLWRDRSIHKGFRAGVSLHSHTMYSEESLETIPRWITTALSRAHVIGNRDPILNLRNAFWTPPLTPRQAHRLEEKQIETQFQLPALVSLTDHDDIRAGTLLRVLDRFRHAPISTEWTVPFDSAFFHIGVHNMPAGEASAITGLLASFTANPNLEGLADVLSMLNSYPGVLLVLNHPLWDEKGIGRRVHDQALGSLLQRHGRSLHALEVNGFRSWRENQRVLRLGQQAHLPVIAGGDRHGLESNAILNLSQAKTLVDFIHEIRYRRFSHVVFMPQYRQPRKLRILQTVVDVLRDYPENVEERRSWTDRVFCRDPETGAPIPFKQGRERGRSDIVRHFLAAMRLIDRRPRPSSSTAHEGTVHF